MNKSQTRLEKIDLALKADEILLYKGVKLAVVETNSDEKDVS